MNYLISWIYQYYTLVGSIIIAIITLIAHFLFVNILKRYLKKKQASNKHQWIEVIVKTINSPGKWFIWFVGFFIEIEWIWRGVPILNSYLSLNLIGEARNIILVIILTWLVMRGKKHSILLIIKMDPKKVPLNSSLAVALSKLSSLVISILSILIILSILEVPLQALLTFGGVGTLAFSWAAKDFIANLFGGLMIHINRPFHNGDWIKSTNKNFEGVVESIGWYMTQIRTFERRPTYIPNGLMTDAIIENPGRMYNRRIKTDIGVRYDDVKLMPQIISNIEQMLKNHPGIAQNQILMVHFVEFAGSSLNINIYCFTKTTNWAEYRAVQQDVFLKISDLVSDLGGEIAFPTRTLHLFNHENMT
jgi:MscS family membrane protein